MRRSARFVLVQTTALALCLVLVCILFSGFTQGEIIALRALEHLGEPYVFGAEGPDKFDCSGLVMYCLIPEGFEFPVHAAELIGTDERFRYIAQPQHLLAGDIVCFDTIRDRDPSDHMGIYLGGNQFVHASSSGEVMISTLEDYYLEKFTGARRYVNPYCDLPSPVVVRRLIEETGIPAWIESLDIPARIESTGIPAWFKGTAIPGWFRDLKLNDRFEGVKGKAVDLWNSIFKTF